MLDTEAGIVRGDDVLDVVASGAAAVGNPVAAPVSWHPDGVRGKVAALPRAVDNPLAVGVAALLDKVLHVSVVFDWGGGGCYWLAGGYFFGYILLGNSPPRTRAVATMVLKSILYKRRLKEFE